MLGTAAGVVALGGLSSAAALAAAAPKPASLVAQGEADDFGDFGDLEGFGDQANDGFGDAVGDPGWSKYPPRPPVVVEEDTNVNQNVNVDTQQQAEEQPIGGQGDFGGNHEFDQGNFARHHEGEHFGHDGQFNDFGHHEGDVDNYEDEDYGNDEEDFGDVCNEDGCYPEVVDVADVEEEIPAPRVRALPYTGAPVGSVAAVGGALLVAGVTGSMLAVRRRRVTE